MTATEPEPPAPLSAAPGSPLTRTAADTPAPEATSVSPAHADLSGRRHALSEVAAELDPDRRADQPAVALRDYRPGCVCLGITGPVDRAMAERLQTLLRELRVRGRRELVITLAGLGPWHPQLARVLAHARIQYLVDGAHVELCDVPDSLAAELGSAGPTTFLVEDTNPRPAAREAPHRRVAGPPRPAESAEP